METVIIITSMVELKVGQSMKLKLATFTQRLCERVNEMNSVVTEVDEEFTQEKAEHSQRCCCGVPTLSHNSSWQSHLGRQWNGRQRMSAPSQHFH